MILFRDDELNYLEKSFHNQNNEMIVLYGQKYVGKQYLLNEFLKSKVSIRLQAIHATEKHQLFLWSKQLYQMGFDTQDVKDYPSFLDSIFHMQNKKTIICIEDFENILKQNSGLMQDLSNLLQSTCQVQIILVSSSISWIENNMVQTVGKAALSITGFLKVKPLPFEAIKRYFYNSSKEECMQIYSILGGFPGLWKYFDINLSARENMIRNLLPTKAFLHSEALQILQNELREISVYATILSVMAEGKYKLNEIYDLTGFSRAKISVYLKNLMELEVVEKLYSIETPGVRNTQKGIYRISHPFIRFYFAFLYPNSGFFLQMDEEKIYQEYVKPYIRAYENETFYDICMQYIVRKNSERKLPIDYQKIGKWIGKAGVIPVIATDASGRSIVAYCEYEKPIMTDADFEWLNYLVKQAEIKLEFSYLFAVREFDEKILLEEKVKGNIKTILLEEM